jgi:hypothetical protein
MPVVVCPHCNQTCVLTEPLARTGYQCPHCWKNVRFAPVAVANPLAIDQDEEVPPPPRRSRRGPPSAPRGEQTLRVALYVGLGCVVVAVVAGAIYFGGMLILARAIG